MKLLNRCIVVTGGTSGVGLELLRQLAPDNQVLVVARDQKKLNDLHGEFPAVFTFCADLSDLQQVDKVALELTAHAKQIDVLINNAAVQFSPQLLDNDFCLDSMAREIDLNLSAVCRLTARLLPSLMASGGESAVLNINSGLALVPKRSSAAYCATKAGLNAFSMSLRYQLSETPVAVMQAFLALIDTDMTHGRGENKMAAAKAAELIIRGVERGVLDNDIGKIKLLRVLSRFLPSVAARIMKNS